MHGNKAQLFEMVKVHFHQLYIIYGRLLVTDKRCSILFLWSCALPGNCIHELEVNTLAYVN